MILTALYADLSGYALPHILWHWGPWTLSVEGITTGIGLGLRVGTFIATSLLFITTTDPTDFAISLVQNLKVPYRFGYGILVSFRFLPSLRSEFEIIRMAQKVRGVGERSNLRGKIQQMQRYAIPLLAAGIRKSERTALAMDAKAFSARSGRTYFRQMRIGWSDIIFILGMLLYVIGIYLIADYYNLADLQWVPDA